MARIAGSDSAKTRALICAKALELSAQTGFEALTMRALATAVGVQVAALYHYFPDKQSLLASLLNDHFDQLLAHEHALPASGQAKNRLLAFARAHIMYHAVNRASALFAMQELRGLSRANADIVLHKRQIYERLLRHILSDGVGEGAFEVSDIALTSAGLLAMLSEVAIWFRPGGKTNLDEISNAYASAALRFVTV
jgi:AcrR family transcriptional regulator